MGWHDASFTDEPRRRRLHLRRPPATYRAVCERRMCRCPRAAGCRLRLAISDVHEAFVVLLMRRSAAKASRSKVEVLDEQTVDLSQTLGGGILSDAVVVHDVQSLSCASFCVARNCRRQGVVAWAFRKRRDLALRL